ncbi:hypothetical protein [Stutzerimonas nosocomialis]|uniref:hypothetical protein n=1 Tax=Stutzerimonas nosocomialis TaxID=1056496 RepID=UPI0011086883|nr:hypothetical protein [Stutzerimonas nosocomialis]
MRLDNLASPPDGDLWKALPSRRDEPLSVDGVVVDRTGLRSLFRHHEAYSFRTAGQFNKGKPEAQLRSVRISRELRLEYSAEAYTNRSYVSSSTARAFPLMALRHAGDGWIEKALRLGPDGGRR